MIDNLLPNSDNRLLIIDWASLSYHQLFALVSKNNVSDYFEIDTPEGELHAWKSKMVGKLLDMIKCFNPRDVILTLEGTKPWRTNYCKEYYEKYAKIFYDKSGYYLKFDNFLYKFAKDEDGKIEFKKLDIIKDMTLVPDKDKKLTELPEKIQTLFWDTVLPKYKGTRSNQYWPFHITKKEWKNFKEKFAKQLIGVFRTHVIGLDIAEGDDVIYVATEYWGKKYDSVVIATCDSDMNQVLKSNVEDPDQKIKIYNHKLDELVVCDDPKTYLELKVLAGDKSDNINGMALPNKKLQLGAAGAAKLYESVGNCFQQAENEGWDNQYLRNKKLIDLSNIPTHIQRELCAILDTSDPEMTDISNLYQLGINERVEQELLAMKTKGFFVLNSKQRIEDNPDIFKKDLVTKEVTSNKFTFKKQRDFDNIDSEIDDPLSEINLGLL